MPDINYIIPLRPIPELKETIDFEKYKKVNLYIDLKNISVGCFIPEIMLEMVYNTKNNKQFDSSLFQSLLYNISTWVSFFKEMNLEYSFYINSDIGKSFYHSKIIPGYKSKRGVAKSTITQDEYEEFTDVRHKNISISEKVINILPNMYFFNLEYLDSDFISYYLISKHFKNEEDTLHIICSGDKDNFQTLNLPNTYIFFKLRDKHVILNKSNFLNYFIKLDSTSYQSRLKKEEMLSNLNPEYHSLFLAITGDASDEIPGCKGIGPGGALEILSDTDNVNKYIGNITEVRSKVLEHNRILNTDIMIPSKLDKKWNKLLLNEKELTAAFKAIDYEILINWLEGPYKESKNKDILKTINKVLEKNSPQINNHKILNEKIIQKLSDCQLDENILMSIF